MIWSLFGDKNKFGETKNINKIKWHHGEHGAHIYIYLTHVILESYLIFEIEKKKTKKRFLLWKSKRKSFEKKNVPGKTQIALLRHALGLRRARENA